MIDFSFMFCLSFLCPILSFGFHFLVSSALFFVSANQLQASFCIIFFYCAWSPAFVSTFASPPTTKTHISLSKAFLTHSCNLHRRTTPQIKEHGVPISQCPDKPFFFLRHTVYFLGSTRESARRSDCNKQALPQKSMRSIQWTIKFHTKNDNIMTTEKAPPASSTNLSVILNDNPPTLLKKIKWPLKPFFFFFLPSLHPSESKTLRKILKCHLNTHHIRFGFKIHVLSEWLLAGPPFLWW